MSEPSVASESGAVDALLALALFALDPIGTQGVVIRSPAGPARDRWLALLDESLPIATPIRRVPLHIPDGRLVGGLDLAGSLASGRLVAERGVLAEADGGVVVLAMAERVEPRTVARLTRVLDTGEIQLERDGLSARTAARFGVVALDEGVEADERVSAALGDRFAFHVDLRAVERAILSAVHPLYSRMDLDRARRHLPEVQVSERAVRALCEACQELGIDSLRAPQLALGVAKGAAALAHKDRVEEEELYIASRLVLSPRATRLPAPPEQEQPSDPASPEPEPEQPSDSAAPPQSNEPDPDSSAEPAELEASLVDRVIEASVAAIPSDLLNGMQLGSKDRSRHAPPALGRRGAQRESKVRGRPIGARRGDPGSGARLDLLETLRAAAPWQRIRRDRRQDPGPRSREAGVDATRRSESGGGRRERRIEVRRDDFRVSRYRQRSETTTIFAVDASGSTALHRLAEAKGAVELMLAESYARRDRVALIAFRGSGAELLLPPTRSLVQAKRRLANLPGGGGTPLAAGIDASIDLAESLRRSGGTPLVILLTDGQANVARDGTPGRERAGQDARDAARRFRLAGLAGLLVDTSPRERAGVRELANGMDARYLLLPHARSESLFEAARNVLPASSAAARSI